MGVKTVRRAAEIAGVLSTYLAFYKLTRHKKKPFGMRLREAFEELGTTFIKFGQLLSSRYDILAEADCRELQGLLDNVPPFSYALVEKMFIHDFGKLPDELYKDFEKEPIASASVSQVYRAKLYDGSAVAVKVRRPFIGIPIEQDMRLLRAIAGFAQFFSPFLRRVDGVKVVDQLSSWLMQEIDFENEKNNIIELRTFAEPYIGTRLEPGLGKMYLPSAYPDLCSKNFITMEYIDGIPLSKFDPATAGDEYDPFLSIKTCAQGSLRQMFVSEEYVFSGDPHPANWMIMKHGDFAVIDFGLIGRMDRATTAGARNLFLAVYARDTEDTIRIFVDLCSAPAHYREKIRSDVDAYLVRAQNEGIGYWFMGLVRIALKHKLPVPHNILLFARMNVMTDGTFHLIDPTKNTLDILGDELARQLRNAIIKNIKSADYGIAMYALSKKIKNNPATLAKLIDKYADDPLRLMRELTGTAA